MIVHALPSESFLLRRLRGLAPALFAAVLAGVCAAGSLHAQSRADVDRIARQMWEDPQFVKEFLGSYGFLAGYEPTISEEEKESLRDLLDLIKASPGSAIRQLEPQIDSDSSAAFDFILANLYFQEGKLAKAREYYNNAIDKYPDFRRAYKNLGLVEVQDGNFDEAIPAISRAMEMGEVDGRSYGLLGYGYLQKERYYPAEAAYRQAILMQPGVKDWKLGLARSLLQSERYGEAISLFDTLLKENPDNADYWKLQGNAYLGADKSMAAARNLEVVRRMGEADLESLKLLGDIYMNNEAPDLALDAYVAAVDKAESGDLQALIRASELFTRTGNAEQAKTMIDRTRGRFDDDLSEEQELKLLTLEAKIARREGNDESAVTALKEIIERDSLNGGAILELADYYAGQGDMSKANNRFEQARKIEGYEREALVAQGRALVREKRYKEALPLLRRALEIKSNSNLEDYADRVERAARDQ